MVVILAILLLAVAAFFVWKSWDPATKTFNWHHGVAGLIFVAAAAWAYLGDLAHHALNK